MKEAQESFLMSFYVTAKELRRRRSHGTHKRSLSLSPSLRLYVAGLLSPRVQRDAKSTMAGGRSEEGEIAGVTIATVDYSRVKETD